jgi:hypothetical protein
VRPSRTGRAYERELTEAVGSSADRWLAELRLAVLGIIISVGLGAADIGLSAGGWMAALVAGVGSVVVCTGLVWWLRPRRR